MKGMDGFITALSSRLRGLCGRGDRKIVRARGVDDFKETVFSRPNGAEAHVSSQTDLYKLKPDRVQALRREHKHGAQLLAKKLFTDISW